MPVAEPYKTAALRKTSPCPEVTKHPIEKAEKRTPQVRRNNTGMKRRKIK